jgi:hypothetical protein
LRCPLLAPPRGKFTGPEEEQIIVKNFSVVKGEWHGRLGGCEESDLFGVVARTRDPAGASYVNHRGGLSARIPIWSRIHSEQHPQLDLERSLLQRLAHSGVLDGFADIDEAPRKRPPKRKILALDKYDPIANFGSACGAASLARG